MASSSSSTESVPPWVELPPEITAAILHKLGTVEILTTAQKVCTTWRRVCRDPVMWRRIHIPYSFEYDMTRNLDRIWRTAVDLSQGHVTEINIECRGSDDLLLYISQRSSQLSRLQLRSLGRITGGGLQLAVRSLPLLEELHLYLNYYGESINGKDVENVGIWYKKYRARDVEAFAIARSMPQLRQLELLGNGMTNNGLKAILDCCPHLESLDLRKCLNVKIDGDLERLCFQRIEDLRLPNDPLDDYPFPGDGCYEFDWDEDYDDYAYPCTDLDLDLGDCYISD